MLNFAEKTQNSNFHISTEVTIHKYRTAIIQTSLNMLTQEVPHIGHIIKGELARQERTVAWLARKLCYSRQNIYHLFECKWIATDVLLRISDVMQHNFFKYYSDYWDGNNVK